MNMYLLKFWSLRICLKNEKNRRSYVFPLKKFGFLHHFIITEQIIQQFSCRSLLALYDLRIDECDYFLKLAQDL